MAERYFHRVDVTGSSPVAPKFRGNRVLGAKADMTEENRLDDSLIEQILTVRNENLRRGSKHLFARLIVSWQRKKILARHKVGIRILNGDATVAEYTVWSSDGMYWDKYTPDIDEDEVWVVWGYDLSYIEQVASVCEDIINKEIEDGTKTKIKKICREDT